MGDKASPSVFQKKGSGSERETVSVQERGTEKTRGRKGGVARGTKPQHESTCVEKKKS